MIPTITQRDPYDERAWREVFQDDPTTGLYERNNIKLILEVMDADIWDLIFPDRLPGYDFENFLMAAARFPAFCGEFGKAASF